MYDTLWLPALVWVKLTFFLLSTPVIHFFSLLMFSSKIRHFLEWICVFSKKSYVFYIGVIHYVKCEDNSNILTLEYVSQPLSVGCQEFVFGQELNLWHHLLCSGKFIKHNVSETMPKNDTDLKKSYFHENSHKRASCSMNYNTINF